MKTTLKEFYNSSINEKQSITLATPDAFELGDRLKGKRGILRVAAEHTDLARIYYREDLTSPDIIKALVDHENKTIEESLTNESLIITNLNNFKKLIKEGWDPSKSNLGHEPWNQENFFENIEEVMIYLEELFKQYNLNLPDDAWDIIIDHPEFDKFETEIENKFNELYHTEFEIGFDTESDQIIYSDSYNKIKTDLEQSGALKNKSYSSSNKILMITLYKELSNKYYEDFYNIYKKYIGDYNITESDELAKYYKKADLIYDKVKSKFKKTGGYENAGQKEIREFEDSLPKEITYNDRSKLMNYINDKIEQIEL